MITPALALVLQLAGWPLVGLIAAACGGRLRDARRAAAAQMPRDVMNSVPNTHNGRPGADEIRAQVARMTKSNVFANSPQLSAFLVFIVEAVLRGKGERLKGYTIGVEVLRRDTSFDPQIDPIVRVEATRLRRAIERYYAGPGASDAIMIGLPRGGYVPRIAWRAKTPVAVAAIPEPAALAPGNGLPTLRVAPFVVIGMPGGLAIDGETLSGKLSEAFALFDLINVIGAAAGGIVRALRLPARRHDGISRQRQASICASSWSTKRTQPSSGRVPSKPARRRRQRRLSIASSSNWRPRLCSRFGIIWSNDRAQQFAANVGDPRYRALIEAGEAFRSFDPAGISRARERA